MKSAALGCDALAKSPRSANRRCVSELSVLAGEQSSAQSGVAEGGGDAENLQLRAAECQCHGKGIVDVVANVGVDDNFFRRFRRRGLRVRAHAEKRNRQNYLREHSVEHRHLGLGVQQYSTADTTSRQES